MADAVSPGTAAPRHSGSWTVVALIVVGLIPFVVSLAVVVYTRRQAAKDPKAQQWIDEHAGKTRLLGAGAGAKK
jgi:hypothetical protein